MWPLHAPSFPGKDPFDPDDNASMAGSILRRQGLGAWEAYTNGRYRQFLQRGGLVGMLQARAGGGGFQEGGLVERFREYVGARPETRRALLPALIGRINLDALPGEISSRLQDLAADEERAGDRAGRAEQLVAAGKLGPNGEPPRVEGLTRNEWLERQLQALFDWRNTLIRGERAVVARRAELTSVLDQARAKFNELQQQTRGSARERERLQRELTRARRNPGRNRDRIRDLQRRIATIDGRVALREALAGEDGIIEALNRQRDGSTEARDQLLTTLSDVQGPDGPMRVLGSTKDVPLGTLGGRIFDVQMRLGERGEATDTGRDSDRASLLEQQLRDANLRTAVSEAHFAELRRTDRMPPYGGSFADGGPVPGPVGAPRTIIAHGGEWVVPREGALVGGGSPVVVLIERGAGVDESKINALAGEAAERALRRAGRGVARALPGQGGGLR
jgi:hypothetical protein